MKKNRLFVLTAIALVVSGAHAESNYMADGSIQGTSYTQFAPPGTLMSVTNSVGVGIGSSIGGANSVAVGQNAQTIGGTDNGVAIGQGSLTGQNGTAIGQGATATGNGSIAIGQGSTAVGNNVVSFGSVGNERLFQNVAAGTLATDAINKSQLDAAILSVGTVVGTVDSIARAAAAASQVTANTGLATAIGAAGAAATAQVTANAAAGKADAAQVAADTAQATGNAAQVAADTAQATGNAAQATANIARRETVAAVQYSEELAKQTYERSASYTDSRFNELNGRLGEIDSHINDVEKSANRGIASALAMQQSPAALAAGEAAITAGFGGYRGATALAVGVHYITPSRMLISAGIASAGGSPAYRLGGSWRFH